jgi:hypothetical protein
LFAVLPLLAWLCWTPGRTRAAAFGVLALALAVAPALLAHAVRAQPTQAWTVVALWDLAALSIEADRVLVPASLTPAGLSVGELRKGFVEYANPPLFDIGKIQVSLYVPYSPAQVSDLQQAWLAAVLDDPAGYLRHRARLARYLLLGFPDRVPRELVYVPERRLLPDTPLTLPAVDEAAPFWRAAAAARSTPLFAGALYLALAAVAWIAVRGHPDARHRGVVRALAASAWANALPLLAITGSAEFRYLAWTALAAVLACALVLAGRRADFG